MSSPQNNDQNSKSKVHKLIKKFGIGGLIFFTAKGLVWLAIFYFGAESIQSCN